MKFSNVNEALRFLSKHNSTMIADGKIIKIVNGVSGLKSCSAIDYLINHSSYNVIFTTNKK